MSRIQTGSFGIYAAGLIVQTPKELHEPLIQIFLKMTCSNYEETNHMRRLIEVNINRINDKLVQRVIKRADKLLKKHVEKNEDVIEIFNTLRNVVTEIKINQLNQDYERNRTNENKRNKSKNNRKVIN
jgi:Zn ribbon nucleic-acid-binding protein